MPFWQKLPVTHSRNQTRWEKQYQHLVVLLLWGGNGLQASLMLFYCEICTWAVVLLYSAFLLKDQADTRLLSDCRGLAWYISSMSMLPTAGNRASKSTRKTIAASAVVTDSSSAHWLRAEEASETDTALIQAIHAWIMSFHFQRELVWQVHALSVLTGNLYVSCARETEQSRGSGFIQMWQGCVNK